MVFMRRPLSSVVILLLGSLLLLIYFGKLEVMSSADSEMTGRKLHVEFEIYGKVQGVFFRKNTVLEGRKLGLRGWCMNTPQGTVKGIMEGDADKIQEMKHWLSKVGSKMSRIDKADFSNEKTIDKYTFTDFSIH